MIRANHSKFHCWLLNLYIEYILRTDFYKVQIIGNVKPDERSILLISNHFSWWDGFFAWHTNRKIFGKKYHVMMLEKELASRMFFSRVGAFSVNHGKRSIIETLNYCVDLLHNPSNMVLMFPQGKLESHHVNKVKFHKGVEHIMDKVKSARVVFAVCLVDYFSNKRPTLTITLKEYDGLINLEEAFNQHLGDCILQQTKLLDA